MGIWSQHVDACVHAYLITPKCALALANMRARAHTHSHHLLYLAATPSDLRLDLPRGLAPSALSGH